MILGLPDPNRVNHTKSIPLLHASSIQSKTPMCLYLCCPRMLIPLPLAFSSLSLPSKPFFIPWSLCHSCSLFSPDPAYSLKPENPTSTLSRNGIVGSLVTPNRGFSLYLPSVQPSTLLEYPQVLPTAPNGAQIRFRDSVAGSPRGLLQ